MASQIQVNRPYHIHPLQNSFPLYSFVSGTSSSSSSIPAKPESKPKPLRLTSSQLSALSYNKNPHEVLRENGELGPESSNSASAMKKSKKRKKRVFFLDVNPLCYNGSTPSLQYFARWVSLFFSQVSLSDPVIAVVDGERGNEYRRQLLSSYKANRRRFSEKKSSLERFSNGCVERSHKLVLDALHDCNVPVVKVEAHEADDVVATLVGQVVSNGYQAVIASPDKDFKQLISKDVQIVLPIQEFRRWSFYTLSHYMAQHCCEPESDLSLRCLLGDEVDGVPGIQKFVPGFGRKTAIKLLKKHGSLENLLNAAAVRTVGKQYVQDALTKYADHLRRNYEVLSLKRDVNVHIEEQWLRNRNSCNDSVALSNFVNLLRDSDDLKCPSESCYHVT